jgi:DNA polymerase III subunit gamma/tau
MKTVSKLNLTRKWRSKTFDTIVGQDVSVRILKNSLFLDQIFPVYLFSGQRGCGKTTTARVFTAALNCSGLEAFRQNPKNNPLPCLTCNSCLAIEQGKHPDFTEIDAASHTGVDNIRQLIETTSFLPIMGRKKVYLVDEVHMLSKAAFNALLKILEEPPLSVIFILATTDPHKVIDTVKSRCFQLFFGPPKTDLLLQHLQQVCDAEKIKADPAALAILIRESEGSVRDAMNLLEQVRFIEAHITVETVTKALGYVSDFDLINLLDLTLSCDLSLPSNLLKLDLPNKNIDFVWRRLCELLKFIVYLKHGVPLQIDHGLNLELVKITNKFDLGLLIKFLSDLSSQEQILLKTTHKALLLELFFLQQAAIKKKIDLVNLENLPVDSKYSQEPVVLEPEPEPVRVGNQASLWQQLLGLLSGCHDPILISIFQQAQFESFDLDQKVQISFSDQGLFFKDLILEKTAVWQNYLQQVFGEHATLEISFVARDLKLNLELKKTENSNIQVKAALNSANNIKQHLDSNNLHNRKMAQKQLDVSNKEQWPLANQILEHFPGQVYEVGE